MTTPHEVRPVDELPTPLDPDTVTQNEVTLPALVTVQRVPAKAGPITSDTFAKADNWVKVLNRDPKRRRAVLMFVNRTGNTDLLVAISRAQSGSVLSGALWPVLTSLTIEHSDELYVAAIGNDTMLATAVTEIWAD